LKHTFSNNKSNDEAEILKGKFQLLSISITTAINMAGKFSGVRTRIQTEIPEAYYVHCYAHCLNLAKPKS
jgi:hypothetical protein